MNEDLYDEIMADLGARGNTWGTKAPSFAKKRPPISPDPIVWDDDKLIAAGGWNAPRYDPFDESPEDEYTNTKGETFIARQVPGDPDERSDVARWVGASVHDAGLRVPTLNGVEAVFIGDWIVRDEDGIVYIYTDEDFSGEFTAA